MKDMITAIKNCGICPEQDMPYVAGNYTTIPPVKAVKDALVNKITGGKMVTGVDGIKTALVTRSQAVAVGMTVYSSMESNSVAKTGILPMPKAKEKQLGGHAVSIVGYKPSIAIKKKLFRKAVVQTGWFIVENSWGTGWGDKGYFYMPYEYVVKGYADEFWIMNI
jgi:C1A family cysteine protease